MSFSYANTVSFILSLPIYTQVARPNSTDPLSIPLLGMLHKQMQPLPALPQFRVISQLPGIDSGSRLKSLMLHLLFATSVACAKEVVSPFFIPEYIKYLPTIYYDARTGHRNHLRASAFQGKRSGTPGYLAAVPHLPVMPDNPVLWDVAVRVTPIGSNVGLTACIGTHAGLVYQFRILRNAAGISALPRRMGKSYFLPFALCHVTPLSKERA